MESNKKEPTELLGGLFSYMAGLDPEHPDQILQLHGELGQV